LRRQLRVPDVYIWVVAVPLNKEVPGSADNATGFR